MSVAEPAVSPSATGTIRGGAGLPQLRRTGSRRRAFPSLLPSSHPAALLPFPRNSRYEREAAGVVSTSVAVAAVAAPAGVGPGPASERSLLLTRPGASQLLRGRKKERRVQGGCGLADPPVHSRRRKPPSAGGGSRRLRGRGRSSGCGRVSPEARGVGRAVGRRLWNGLRTGVDSGEFGGPGSTSRWVQFSRNRDCVCMALAWHWRRAGQRALHGRVSAHSPVSRLHGRGRPGLPVTCNFIASRFLLFWNPDWL